MTYKIVFKKSAEKELLKLPLFVQKKLREALILLSHNPFPDLLVVKKLKGEEDLYRIRVGDYRLIYELQKAIITIVVIRVGHRKDIYR